MVSFCWKINVLPNKILFLFCFIDNVLEINYQSCCILSGPPCIVFDKHDSKDCICWLYHNFLITVINLVSFVHIIAFLWRLTKISHALLFFFYKHDSRDYMPTISDHIVIRLIRTLLTLYGTFLDLCTKHKCRIIMAFHAINWALKVGYFVLNVVSIALIFNTSTYNQ